MSTVRILVLGHKGMLGRTLCRYFDVVPSVEIITTNLRWGDANYQSEILSLSPDFIINCIGKIPQKNPSEADYHSINIALPRFLETLNIPIIHPSTDCEFNGALTPGQSYTTSSLRDATDAYGQSKALISEEIEKTFVNTKIIRTSIIGHEEHTAVSLLDWFLSQTGNINGYTNHYWNGITTLQWAKESHAIIANWAAFPVLNQRGTTMHYSKFDILTIAKAVYKKDITITPFTTEVTINKCLLSDVLLPELPDQLQELKLLFEK